MSDPRRFWPELTASLVLLGAVGWLATGIISGNSGDFTYCLDDAYIHLAIAKNLAAHHVWGVTPYEFTSASSSPLWVLLLAGAFVLRGVDVFLPLTLNVLSALAVLWIAGAVLRRAGLRPALMLVWLIGIVALAPLPTLVLTGMEHSLHIALVFGWLWFVGGVLSEGPRRLAQLGLLAALLAICRFESLALIVCTCALLCFRRQWKASAAIGAAAGTAVGAFSAFSIAHGWHALPNSVLMKAPEIRVRASALHWLGGNLVETLWSAPHLSVLLALCVAMLVWSRWRSKSPQASSLTSLLLVATGTTALHMQFGRLGWFYRYEAYLVAMDLLILGVATAAWLRETTPQRSWVVGSVCVAAALYPLGRRGWNAAADTAFAAKNIHDQHWQVGRFLQVSLGDRSVLLNDIGVPSFLSDAHITDAAGLGSGDVADLIMQHAFSVQALDDVARKHHVELAIVNEKAIPGVPWTWRWIASWTAPPPMIIVGDATVAFYAVDPSQADDLTQRIRSFSKDLPDGTGVRIARQQRASPGQ